MSVNKKLDGGAKTLTGKPIKVKTNLKSGLMESLGNWFAKDENGLWRLKFGQD